MWLEKIDTVKTVKPGLGLLSLKLKIHREASRHIIVEEVNKEEKTQVKSPRSSVFNLLGVCSTQAPIDEKEKVLDRLSKPSVFS